MITGPKGVFRYPGSKNRSASEIIKFFPEHDIYVEPFGFNGRRSGWPLSIDSNSRPAVDLDFLMKISERLSRVQFENRDYQELIEKVIEKKKDQKVLFYLDPPYPNIDPRLYDSEFDNSQFEEYLQTIEDPWILSYPVKLDDFYNIEIEINYALNKRQKVTEYLVSNQPLRKVDLTKLGRFF